MKKKLPYILFAIMFLAGLSLLVYPTFSNYWNSLHQSRAILNYTEAVDNVDKEEFERMFAAAEAYNAGLLSRSNPYLPSEEERAAYASLLDLTGTGIMGYIEIPQINVNLPIYHGTSESVLQTAIGHLEWTSLPVGGADTHCVLSGHRGLPSAKLFTDLDKLVEGDVFYLYILDELFTYEVDQILIVEPQDVSALTVKNSRDYCTLVTCTPYGINTHRMLVRGRRIANAQEEHIVRVVADASQIEPVIVAPIIALPLLVVFIGFLSRDDKTRPDDSPTDL